MRRLTCVFLLCLFAGLLALVVVPLRWSDMDNVMQSDGVYWAVDERTGKEVGCEFFAGSRREGKLTWKLGSLYYDWRFSLGNERPGRRSYSTLTDKEHRTSIARLQLSLLEPADAKES